MTEQHDPDEPRPVLVIHGVATRDRELFEREVRTLGDALGSDVGLIPVYWGDFARPAEAVDRLLPYRGWSAAAEAAAADDVDELDGSLKDAIAERDLGEFVALISESWQRRSERSRRRLLGNLYERMSDGYLRASAEYTGDLVLYQRRQEDLHAVVWEAVMRHAPGYGLAERPIDVICHSLGSTILFDMAVAGHPRLHIDHLITCASQISFFRAIGASSVPGDVGIEDDLGTTVTLPASLGSWVNFFVPLDPWAFLAAPVYRLHDDTAPEDVELYAGVRADRILKHSASHYWTHPVALSTMRSTLGLSEPETGSPS